MFKLLSQFVSTNKTENFVINESVYFLIRVMEPFVPHMTDALWNEIGYEGMLVSYPWPSYDNEMLIDNKVKIVVQLNGKLKGSLEVLKDAEEEVVKNIALEFLRDNVVGKEIRKIIFVPNKIINIVT